MSYKIIYRDLNGPKVKRSIKVAGYVFTNGKITEVDDLNKLKIILKRSDMALVDERENTLVNLTSKPKKPRAKPKAETKQEVKQA